MELFRSALKKTEENTLTAPKVALTNLYVYLPNTLFLPRHIIPLTTLSFTQPYKIIVVTLAHHMKTLKVIF